MLVCPSISGGKVELRVSSATLSWPLVQICSCHGSWSWFSRREDGWGPWSEKPPLFSSLDYICNVSHPSCRLWPNADTARVPMLCMCWWLISLTICEPGNTLKDLLNWQIVDCHQWRNMYTGWMVKHQQHGNCLILAAAVLKRMLMSILCVAKNIECIKWYFQCGKTWR